MNLYYVMSEYFATGEGMTISILITPAIPRADDYVKPHDYNDLKTHNTPEERAINECKEKFGYFGLGAQIVEYQKIERYLPEFVKNFIKDNNGSIHYHSQFHFNLS